MTRARGRGVEWFRSGVRPVLTMLIFLSAAGYMWNLSQLVAAEADALGRATAHEMLAQCERTGECPESPPGWYRRTGRTCKSVEFMQVCYQRGNDHATFGIRVRHRSDDYLNIHGGVNQPLEEQRVCC